MMTTENTSGDAPTKKKTEVTKEDAKLLTEAYNKGATIDDLADEYGYTPLEVSDIVVKEAPEDPTVLQSELDEQPATPTKKGK